MGTGTGKGGGYRVRAKRRLPTRPITIALLILGLVYGGYRLIRYQRVDRYIQDTDDAYIRANVVTISSKLGGYITSVRTSDNQQILRGALLAEIDPVDYASHVEDAQAQIDVAGANHDAARAAIAEATAGIAQATATLSASQGELAHLNRKVALYRSLVRTGAEPQQTYDQCVADRDKAAQDVAVRQAALAATRSQSASAQARLKQAEAQLRSAQGKKRASENDLGHARITAPIGGTVASSALRLGQFVQPGQRLLSIVPTHDVYIEANFKETQIGLMRPGQRVAIHVDALSGIEFKGYLESVSPGTGANFSLIPPQNATGNFTKIVQRVPVRIYIDAGPESRRVIVPGLSVQVSVDTRSGQSARDAIEREQRSVDAR